MDTREMSGIILAGGKSSRMGANKLFLPLGGKPLVGHLIETMSGLFAETIIVTDTPDDYLQFQIKATKDLISCKEKNSLTGIHSGLHVAQKDYSLVCAGDMPFIRTGVIEALCSQADGYDVTIIQEGRHYQPLCAVYHKNCLPHIERLLANEHYKILDFFADVRVSYVDIASLKPLDINGLSFFNINTPNDYQRAQSILESIRES